MSARDKTIYCPVYASLAHQTAITQKGRGFHLPHMWQYYLEGLTYMRRLKNPTLGNLTQSRTALAVVAATLLVGGSVTEASAKSRHHHHYRHHHHSHHASNSPAGSLGGS